MMFVLEINGGLLHLFSDAAEAESQLEAIDIENAEYEFCDDTGQRFVGQVVAPAGALHSGKFHLRPDGAPNPSILASILSWARSLERQCGGVRTLDDLRKMHA